MSFDISKGESIGLLGPNGAGKSTTMKVMTGFTPQSSGEVRIGGFDILKNSIDARKQIGYLPENVPLYTDMSVKEYLKYITELKNDDFISHDSINELDIKNIYLPYVNVNNLLIQKFHPIFGHFHLLQSNNLLV